MQFATCSAWKESSSKVQSSGTWLFQQCCSSWEHPAWWTSPCWARQRLQPYACDATSRHWKSSFLAGWLVPAPAIMRTLELAQSPAFSPSKKATKRHTFLWGLWARQRTARGVAFWRTIVKRCNLRCSRTSPANSSCEFCWIYRSACRIIYVYVCIYIYTCNYYLPFYASIDLPAIRDVSILNGRSLPYIYRERERAYMLLSSLCPWKYIGPSMTNLFAQAICVGRLGSNCASFVLSIIMNVAQDRCVSVWNQP